jgi:peptidoglycan/xylan/chitin deacetylase (PgdA/CDA1 family)
VLVDRGRKDGFTRRLFALVRDSRYWLGVAGAGGPLDGDAVRVLCWHAIADLAGDPVVADYGVPPASFRAQLETLRNDRWTFVTADEFLGFVRGIRKLPRRSVLLTFDDGFADLGDEVVPVLAHHRAPGVAFIVSELIGDRNRWDIEIGARPIALADGSTLLGLPAAGVEIGAHSRSHARLTALPPAELEDEVAGCKAQLEALGLPRVRFFAYPGGVYDGRVREAVRSAGFDAAFTVVPAKVTPRVDPFAVPRMEIMPSDVGRRLVVKVRRGRPAPPRARTVRRWAGAARGVLRSLRVAERTPPERGVTERRPDAG